MVIVGIMTLMTHTLERTSKQLGTGELIILCLFRIFAGFLTSGTIRRLGLAGFSLLAAQHLSADEGQTDPGTLRRAILEFRSGGSASLADRANWLPSG